MLPLKRTKTRGNGIHSEFVHTRYLPLQTKSCTIIFISIYNEGLAMVRFLSGIVIVNLHLRPIFKGRDGLSSWFLLLTFSNSMHKGCVRSFLFLLHWYILLVYFWYP